MIGWQRKGIFLFLILCMLALASPVMAADPLDQWSWRNPLPQGNTLYGVVYVNNTVVAVGYGGIILTSPDGETWASSTSGTNNNLRSVTYANNTFVVVGNTGTILTSTDGVNWTSRTSGTTNNLLGVTYGNNIFVAVGAGGVVLTSPDGVNWTSMISGTTSALLGVTYANNTFVAVGSGGIIITSPNGVTWTTMTSATTYSLYGVTYANNTFVVVGNTGTILTSTDGVNWTSRTSGTTNFLWGVIYANNTFVAVGAGGVILTSPDGVNWTSRLSRTTYTLRGITFDNNTLVVVGDSGMILQSEPLISSDVTNPQWVNASLTASDITQNTLTLSWTSAQDAYGVVAYKIYKDGNLLESLDGNVYSYQATNLSPDTTYNFKIEAGDASGNWSSDGPITSAKTLAPNGTKLSISEPNPKIPKVGDIFGIDVIIESVYNLQGLDFKLSYDPTVVAPIDLSNTVAYDSNYAKDGMMVVKNEVYDNKVWSVAAWTYSDLPQGQTLINPTKVGTVKFRLLREGLVDFKFTSSDMKKNTFNGSVINVQSISHETIGRTVYFYIMVPVAPEISPNGGTYNTSQTVTIGNIDSSGTAYYTLDGTVPTQQSQAYTVPFTLDHSATITAAVYDTNTGLWSAPATETFYVIPVIISLEPASQSIPVNGQTITVAAKIYFSTDLYGGDLELHFNPQVLEVTNITVGDAIYGLSVAQSTYYDNTNGVIKVSSSRTQDNNGFNGDGELLQITFKGKSPGISQITLGETTLSDSESNPITYTFQPGQIEVIPGISVGGQVYLQGLRNYAGGVNVKLIDQNYNIIATVTTDTYGRYFIDKDINGNPLPQGTFAIVASKPVYLTGMSDWFTPALGSLTTAPSVKLLSGDIEVDNKVDLSDFIQLANIYGNNFTWSNQDDWQPPADLNRDNRTSIFDLVLLARNYGKTIV